MSRRSRRKNRHNNAMKEKETNTMENKTSMETLDSAVLERDFTYQRPVNMNRVREIVAEFDKDLVNILKVSFRDGHYYVFDGSHTLEALRIVNAKEHFPVVCKLYKGLTYEREAELFARQNGNATRVGTPYKLRALEQAGDEVTVHFLETTRKTGFEIAPGERTSKKNTISAVCKANAVSVLRPTSSSTSFLMAPAAFLHSSINCTASWIMPFCKLLCIQSCAFPKSSTPSSNCFFSFRFIAFTSSLLGSR